MRFQRGNIWLKSGREKSPLPPFAKAGWFGAGSMCLPLLSRRPETEGAQTCSQMA